MDPEEIEYIAENGLISIIPTFNGPIVSLVAGDFGPFRAGLPVRVPLWVGINFKQQQKCKIQPPEWMDIEILETAKENEKNSRTFTKMPSEHYMIEAKLLLGHASDDIPNADQVKTIIKDLWDIRMSKLRSSIDILVKGSGSYATVDNLTMMEINSVKPLLPHALNQLYRMKKNCGITGSQTQNSSSLSSNFISH